MLLAAPLCLCGKTTRSLSLAVLLEVQTPLQFHHSARESALGAAEDGAVNVGAPSVEAEGLKVEYVEDVEEVRLHFEERALAERFREAEALGEAHVNVEVARASERVAPDARQPSGR